MNTNNCTCNKNDCVACSKTDGLPFFSDFMNEDTKNVTNDKCIINTTNGNSFNKKISIDELSNFGNIKNVFVTYVKKSENKKGEYEEIYKTSYQNVDFKNKDALYNIFHNKKPENKITNTEKQENPEIKDQLFSIDPNTVYEILKSKTSTLLDIISLGKKYDEMKHLNFAFDFKALHNIVPELEELNNMVGMQQVKQSVLKQILYFLLKLEPLKDMMHIIIQGPPGTGKTALGVIFAKIYNKLNIIEKPNNTKKKHESCNNINVLTIEQFLADKLGEKQENSTSDSNTQPIKIYKRSDLIGGYLGQTAIKTQKAIDECIGKVMFIDEGYSIGNTDKSTSDTYANECINTLNQNLTEKAGQFVCIVAGYEDKLEECFFSANPGLRRRFPFCYTIEKYSAKELQQIFNKKVEEGGWKIDNANQNNIEQFFSTNHKKNKFPHFGGDMESLFLHVKLAHGMRIFGLGPDSRNVITFEDIVDGMIEFEKTKKYNQETISSMYC